MADRDLLDYLDESELNVNHTPNGRLGMGRLSRSRQSSVRKSGKFRMLYTPKQSLDLEENAGNLPEPHSRRIRLSSTSLNATVGDGSHISTSFDVVDVTPGINRTQMLPFLSCLKNCTSVSGRNIEVAPKSMQQHKTVCDLINKNYGEGLSPLAGSSERHADAQIAAKVAENKMVGRRESKSPSISGITRLQATKTSAMSSKVGTPVCSIDGNSSVVSDRMCTREVETAHHTKLDELGHISELTQTSHRAEEVASIQKPQQLNEEEDELPATQPVSSLLLKGQY
ncbi:hypothetical protein Cfor_07871 [Coptotermes formosanus]|jgi:hypothetical protein|uniref:Uncharacterized protein n=1 Tax=Coptotermes formosanus TaxID=36987 RepID=A0A6L2P7S7_COPFO|nr:hypothetical protein Cfor_07871 [Coptotermes formosanus]